ncbi:MAG TPA: Rieske 2Fe-2S domain-containing protein [Candidatus Limnocylindria bacterium]|nr:Rieske 2Fe-2S domain-containing protein [Candidatus Limnocylindria bacterium]
MLERAGAPFRGFGDWLARVVDGFYRVLGRPGKWLQDFVNGTWLGHPLHPVLTDVVIGGATLIAVFDLSVLVLGAEGLETASLVAVGFVALSALGATASGLTDFKDTHTGNERNVVVIHGLINIVATAVYVVSFLLRFGGSDDIGIWFSLGGVLILTVGGYIGGHVVYKYGYTVNRNAFAKGQRAKEWTPVIAAADVPENTPTKVMLGSTALVVVRRGDMVHALKGTCSHAGGPLDQGELVGDTIVCPWHFSAFRLSDGAVRHGPATSRQVRYDTRVNDLQIEVQGPID